MLSHFSHVLSDFTIFLPPQCFSKLIVNRIWEPCKFYASPQLSSQLSAQRPPRSCKFVYALISFSLWTGHSNVKKAGCLFILESQLSSESFKDQFCAYTMENSSRPFEILQSSAQYFWLWASGWSVFSQSFTESSGCGSQAYLSKWGA